MKNDVERLADTAWSLLKDALEKGEVEVGGRKLPLDSEQVVNLALKVSQIKINKPKAADLPEDFKLLEIDTDE